MPFYVVSKAERTPWYGRIVGRAASSDEAIMRLVAVEAAIKAAGGNLALELVADLGEDNMGLARVEVVGDLVYRA